MYIQNLLDTMVDLFDFQEFVIFDLEQRENVKQNGPRNIEIF